MTLTSSCLVLVGCVVCGVLLFYIELYCVVLRCVVFSKLDLNGH